MKDPKDMTPEELVDNYRENTDKNQRGKIIERVMIDSAEDDAETKRRLEGGS